MTSSDLDRAFSQARLAAAELALPEIAESTSYGTPALKVRKKLLLRLKDADTFVFMCPLEEKEFLMRAAPEIYFETDHYKGWPAVLARRADITGEELKHRITQAWRSYAPKSIVKRHDEKGAAAPKPSKPRAKK